MYVLPSALLGLLVGAVIAGFGFGMLSVFFSPFTLNSIFGSLSLGLFLTIFAVPLGFLVVLFLGVPTYTLLVRLNIASYWSAALVGVLPGLILLALQNHEFSLPFLLFGVVVALCTHFFTKRNTPLFEHGANYSLKRTAVGRLR